MINYQFNYQFILPHKTKKFTNYIINTKEWQGSPKRSKAYKLLGYLITDTIYIYKIQKMQMKKRKTTEIYGLIHKCHNAIV
jgi:hypothetical protein